MHFGQRIFTNRQAQVAVLCTTAILIASDILGISLAIFQTNPLYVSGLFLGSHNFPIEELLLLLFLPYVSLVLGSLLFRTKA
jgi:lycopene cyclase domain-containing protein